MRRALAMLALAACGPTARSPRGPVVADVAPSVDAAAPTVLAAQNAGEDDLTLLQQICAVTYVTYRDGRRLLACRSHPPFERKAQRADGRVTEWTGDVHAACAVTRIHRGSFTRAGATEAVIAFNACYEDGANFKTGYANAYSTVLVEKVNGNWQAAAYDEVDASSCQRGRRADGREVLFCEGSASFVVEGQLAWVYVIDYAHKGQHAGAVAYLWSSAFDCNTFGLTNDTAPNGLVVVEQKPGRVVDVNGDGSDDYVFEVARSRVRPDPSLDAALGKICVAGGSSASLLPPPTTTTIEIVAGKSSYQPPPEAFRTLKIWELEGPSFIERLMQAAPPPIWP